MNPFTRLWLALLGAFLVVESVAVHQEDHGKIKGGTLTSCVQRGIHPSQHKKTRKLFTVGWVALGAHFLWDFPWVRR